MYSKLLYNNGNKRALRDLKHTGHPTHCNAGSFLDNVIIVQLMALKEINEIILPLNPRASMLMSIYTVQYPCD